MNFTCPRVVFRFLEFLVCTSYLFFSPQGRGHGCYAPSPLNQHKTIQHIIIFCTKSKVLVRIIIPVTNTPLVICIGTYIHYYTTCNICSKLLSQFQNIINSFHKIPSLKCNMLSVLHTKPVQNNKVLKLKYT